VAGLTLRGDAEQLTGDIHQRAWVALSVLCRTPNYAEWARFPQDSR
jgi:hypothetical protein